MGGVVLGCDIGGTFTDCVLHDLATGRVASRKVPTSVLDPSEAALTGLLALLSSTRASAEDVVRVVHGTTVGTNAVLTRRGPRVGLVTNAGFEDILEIARQDRPALYDLRASRPPPLAARGDRFGVRGRLDERGREIEPVRPEDLDSHLPAISRCGAFAVVLLHSYANPEHERRVRARLATLAPGVPIALSSDTSPEFREYERGSTTAIDAFLRPVMDRYLGRLVNRLADAGIRAPLFVLESGGGVLTPAQARARPVATVLSGPAGGAAACARVAGILGERRLLGVDMGGTSTDLSVVVDGAVREAIEGDVGGLPVRFPMLDITTLGAGGGSIARVDEGGLLRVGPESAEAVPGPACYGRGGAAPTVTDAHVALGHVESLLDGAFLLDRKAAEAAVARVGDRLGLDVASAAEAIVQVTDANLLAAARLATTARGEDPREFALCAFGGAGPLHAVALARGLGVPRVVVPPHPGVLSAWGMLASDLRRDAVRTWLRDASSAPDALRALGTEASSALAREGVRPEAIEVRFALDIRYRGQSHELAVPIADPDDARDPARAFRQAHEREFGFLDPRAPIELVNLRAKATARVGTEAREALPTAAAASPGPDARLPPRRIGQGGSALEFSVWRRSALLAGHEIAGPAVVEDAGSTLLLPPGSLASVHASGALVVEVGP